MRVAIRADPIERPGRVAHEPRVEAEIAGHPRRRLDAMIGGGAADHERGDVARAQARLESVPMKALLTRLTITGSPARSRASSLTA